MATSNRPPIPYDLHPSVAYVQAILGNFKAKTGRTMEDWVALLHRERPGDPKAWLKGRGLGTNQAGFVLQRAGAASEHAFADTPEGYLAAAPGYVDQQYGGKKVALRPLFEHLVALVRDLGPDVRVCPCETLVPFYRNHVFAEAR